VFDESGRRVENVVEVDTTAGFVIRYAQDEQGAFIVVGEEYVTERVDGKFTIKRNAS
jgi:hypothetical protein